MQKLTRTRRKTVDGKTRVAAVNVAQVLYVHPHKGGSIIVFAEMPHEERDTIVPMGIDCPDSVDTVVRRLNRPYWIDFSIRVGGLYLAAAALVGTLLFGLS